MARGPGPCYPDGMTRLALCATAALIAAASFLASAPHAAAQGWFSDRSERANVDRRYRDADDAYFERRLRYYRRDNVARREAMRRDDEDEGRRGGMNFFQRLFGGRQQEEDSGWRGGRDAGAVEVRPKPRKPPRRRPPPAVVTAPPPVGVATAPAGAVPVDPALVGAAPGAAVVAPPPAGPVAPTAFVMVIGDSIADGLAGGLEEGFADTPEIAVKRVAKANSGLVREDYFDFVKETRKALDAGPATYAVFDVGVNDRQPFLDARKDAPLSDEWKRRYAVRIDAMLAPFKERRIPIYWVGLAPSESNRATTDHVAINALAKERVEAANGTYVDVWEGFVDDDGDYAEFGLKLDGQMGRLRLDDGVHFSKAGARKLAHYVEQEIRKVFQPKPVTPDAMMAAVAPQPGAESAPQPGPAAEKPRPIASSVLVLTAAQRAPNGSLAASPIAVPARDASESAARVLVKGEAPEADPGRLDDHRWPDAAPAKREGGASALLDQARPPEPAPEAKAASEAKVSPEAKPLPAPRVIDPRQAAQPAR